MSGTMKKNQYVNVLKDEPKRKSKHKEEVGDFFDKFKENYI